MEKKVISCEFNIDTACVEVKYADSSMISIDCTRAEKKSLQCNDFFRLSKNYRIVIARA